jgi:hypothetical protein
VGTRNDEENLATLTPLMGISLPHANRIPEREVAEPALWFVTVTVGGVRQSALAVRVALERLSEWNPFLVSAGYASRRAEIRYWDESMDVEGAVAQALQLSREFLDQPGLQQWQVIGLEVVDRATARRRWAADVNVPTGSLGAIHAMEAD